MSPKENSNLIAFKNMKVLYFLVVFLIVYYIKLSNYPKSMVIIVSFHKWMDVYNSYSPYYSSKLISKRSEERGAGINWF